MTSHKWTDLLKIRQGKYTSGNCNKTSFLQCTPQTKHFKEDEKHKRTFHGLQMLYSIKKERRFRNLKLVSRLQSQVKAIRLQDKVRKQNFHQDMKKVLEPVTESIENVSEDVTKIVAENSKKKAKH